MCAFGSDGLPNSHCDPCLVGERWDELRQDLGTYLVAEHRNFEVKVAYAEWLSASLVSSAFRIVLQASIIPKLLTITYCELTDA
jgi:hypothetical protein